MPVIINTFIYGTEAEHIFENQSDAMTFIGFCLKMGIVFSVDYLSRTDED